MGIKGYKKTLISCLIISAIGLLTANFVAAAGIHKGPIIPCGLSNDDSQTPWNEQDSCDICRTWQLGSNIINFISFNLAFPAASILFIVAGFIFLTSGGRDERITLAKNIFTNVVIGIVIIFCSWLIIDTLFKTIANPSSEAGKVIFSWKKFPQCQ